MQIDIRCRPSDRHCVVRAEHQNEPGYETIASFQTSDDVGAIITGDGTIRLAILTVFQRVYETGQQPNIQTVGSPEVDALFPDIIAAAEAARARDRQQS